MAAEKKENRKYVFTVEGETEQWYLEWLQEQINACNKSKYTVSIVAKVQQSPKKYSKTVNPIATPRVTHICDYESNDAGHVAKFQNILSELKEANSTIGRKFKYSLGYSNFTFELWIVLHKQICNGILTHRTQYLSHINRAYDENFENLDQYKHEDNFKRCLAKLNLDNVRMALKRSKSIMDIKEANGEHPEQYKGFKYYKENPALTVWESVEAIFLECELI
jgi:hypothetical protein